eukprot:TRINITY_DN10778_c0_g1_i3.p1 TRINITY_DN10778_c0_g1~~TRINITY_DN10778_c0_g1_i3.p1  ORF type:complete len:119 (-),score=10.57 TRINITY_DN10778_c0_g1_i3:158-514(-)
MTVFSRAIFFFFQAEDGIRDLVRSRGLGDVYKRQVWDLIVQVGKIITDILGLSRKIPEVLSRECVELVFALEVRAEDTLAPFLKDVREGFWDLDLLCAIDGCDVQRHSRTNSSSRTLR